MGKRVLPKRICERDEKRDTTRSANLTKNLKKQKIKDGAVAEHTCKERTGRLPGGEIFIEHLEQLPFVCSRKRNPAQRKTIK